MLINILWFSLPLFLISALSRIYVYAVAPAYFGLSFVTGLIDDMLWAALAGVILGLFRRGRTFALLFATLIWALVTYLDSQSLIALGVVADYRDFHYVMDPVFLSSTLRGLNIASVLIGVCGLAMLGTACFALQSRISARPSIPYGLTLFASLSIALALWNNVISTGEWQQQNSIGAQLKLVWLDQSMRDHSSNTQGLVIGSGGLLDQEAPLKSQTNKHKNANVLLLVLEGIPGAYFPQISKPVGITPPMQMKALSPWLERSWYVPQMVTHTRQTLRGLHAMLCGDYPRLIGGTPKPIFLLNGSTKNHECLPEKLRTMGYHTAFIQAADLEFMSKASFMPKIGFEQVEGKKSFSQSQAVTNTGYSWGPTDEEFLLQTRPRLESIAAQNKPWFVTLLTAGTHYPYGITQAAGATALDNKFAAVAAADSAAANFLQYLQDKGFLDDTLVLVTSDESHGLPDHWLGANWGFLFALAPDLNTKRVEGLFGSVDIPASIADYLGLAFPRGNSIFASNNTKRKLFMGQHSTVYMVDGGLVHQCWKSGLQEGADLATQCGSSRALGSPLFTENYESLAPANHLDAYRDLVKGFWAIEGRLGHSDAIQSNFVTNADYPLKRSEVRVLGGGQFIDIPKSSRVVSHLDLEYLGEGVVNVSLSARDPDNTENLFPSLTLPPMKNGQRLVLDYHAGVQNRQNRTQFFLKLTAGLGAGVFKVHHWSVSIDPGQDEPTQARVDQRRGFRAITNLEFKLRNTGSEQELAAWIPYQWGTEMHPAAQPSLFISGWYTAESNGIWSKERGAISIPIQEIHSGSITLTARSRVLLGESGQESVEITVNGKRVGTWKYQKEHNFFERSVKIPVSLMEGEDELLLEMVPSATRSPNTKDTRQLGVFLESLSLKH